MAEEIRKGANTSNPDPGPFLAKVVSHLDPSYMGTLEVQLLHEAGNDEDREGQLRTVKYLNPFYGSTSIDYVTEDPDVHDNTQKSYGMWFVPPDVGQIVACIFIGGDTRKGYWFGCVQNEDVNFSLPGYAATQYVVDDSRETDTEKTRVPVTEYNKIIHTEIQADTTKKLKPEHPLAKKLESQGLLKDDIRGITTSSARREVPSMVFGISTPGPVDKTGKKGKVGKHEHKIPAAFVSRLGGSSFVMDDGDDKFLRKTKAHEGPPEYAALEQGEDGIKDILHNELIRLRTRTGHQILMHNSEDLIYIGNSRGTAWIELTSDGKIEIYAEDSISFRTKQDFNFYADRDINIEAGRNFNTKVHGEMHTNVVKDQVLIVDRDQKIHIKRRRDETIDEQLRQTVNDDVKKYYAKDYTHNVDGRMDFKVANGFSFSGGNGASGATFAPATATSQDPADPVSNDTEASSPVAEVNGPTPDRIDIKIYKDMRVEHIGVNVDHTIRGYLKTKITGNVDLHTDGTYEHYTAGNVDIKTAGHLFQQSTGDFEVKAGGHIYNTSGGTNETNAGGNIVETAPEIHMNGPGAASAGGASTAQIAVLPEEARTSAKSSIPLNLKTHKLVDLSTQDAWESLEEIDAIMRRVPTPEPYPLHENLDPLRFKPDKLDRDQDGRYSASTSDMTEPAGAWRTYSTTTDTFAKVAPPNQEE
jgi:hypothetical protein